MTIEQFWHLVEMVHAESNGDMDIKCRLLGERLYALGSSEAYSFEHHFSECLYRAYRWELWNAAYIINGGCSDDSFSDFRSTLISMGRHTFDAALADPDSLADVDVGAGDPTYEGYQYVAPEVYDKIVGKPIPRLGRHPTEPTGVQANEWEMERRFPKLTAKFEHKDSDSMWLKDRADREAEENRLVDKLTGIILEGGIIPACGLIPPFAALADVLRNGAFAGSRSTWQPIELKESIYWKTVLRLEQMQPQDHASRPDLQGVKIRQDTASNAKTFNEWLSSIGQRDKAE